jgi:para-nitrobenzyl esterase
MAPLAASAGASDRVTIDSGTLQGTTANDVISFKGIPFAAPPLGARRWKPPQPVTKWEGVRDAATYGADCMQEPFPGDAAPLGVTPNEDCLYLNVWLPAKAELGKKLPVMVWIYGGGFVNGGASPAVYDGSQFAKDGIVLVSFNYRLGNLGFFAHPALSAEQPQFPAVNFGVMDQIAALKWVKRNIAAFGGDAHNITIFGESAGGMSVNMLLTSPLAAGLFQKAIIESGGGRPGMRPSRSLKGPDSAESVGLALAKEHGMEGEGADALAKLREIPAEQLKRHMMSRGGSYVGGPVVDGKLNLGSPATLYAAGKGAHVPVMVGANSADIGFAEGKTIDELFAQFGPDEHKARMVYNPDNSTDVRAVGAKIGADQGMIEPAREIARLLSAHGQPVYEYRFSYVAESLRGTLPGALHATEIPFAFDTVSARYGKDLTPADEAAAKAMHSYWVAFAKTGKPEPKGLPAWPAYHSKTDQIMDFTNSGPVAGHDPWKARMDLAAAVASRREQQSQPPTAARRP